MKDGHCNGSRYQILELKQHTIRAALLTGPNRGAQILFPRLTLSPSTTAKTLGFSFMRQQFPLRPAYALTISKAQGQSFDHCGLWLPTPVFSHGQLYVGCSRATSAAGLHVYIPDVFAGTRNVVFPELLHQHASKTHNRKKRKRAQRAH